MTHADQNDLAGRRALVCGASRGIGLACARELASRGARVTILSRDPARLDEILTTLPGTGHERVAVDIGDPAALESAVQAALDQGGVFHILVNNSGGPASGPLHLADPKALAPAFLQHVVAAQTLARLILPGMREAGYGRILNIISTSVKTPLPGLGVSNTVRGAMANWGKTLATEVAGWGITVNNILPGATRTERLASLIAARAERESRSTSEVETAMRNQIPAGRFAEPEEIGAAVGFLASPAAAYITGINLPVDGGRTPSL